MALLEVQGLTKHFDLSGDILGRLLHGQKVLKAVDGISFAINEGETVGLVGESGCGKSTTARLITRLIAATAGKVDFLGKDILTLPCNQGARDKTGYSNGFPGPLRLAQSAHEGRRNCRAAADASIEGLRGAKKIDGVSELLELVGLSTDCLYRYPHEFSGGQRQRIGIARALAPRPKLLIADEPVSSLDVSVQAQVLNLFGELKRRLKLTMLFISHDLNVVEYLADTVAVMYAGKIMEIAPVEQIFKLPLHPYTQGLIASNPTPESYMEQPMRTLRGEVLLPLNPPPGCRLEPRCPLRVERCKSAEPLLEEKHPRHWAACHEV